MIRPLNKRKQSLVSRMLGYAAGFYLRKPDRAEFLKVKIGNLGTMKKLALNELFFLLNSDKSKYVTSLNIEVTNMCNLSCSICPVNRGMKRAKGMMTLELFNKIINESKRVDSVQFSQWGEPLMHPHICEMIKLAKNRDSEVFLITNGTLIDERLSYSLLDSGLDRIIFSVDGINDTHSKIRGYAYSELKKKIMNFKNIRDRCSYSTKIDASMIVCDDTISEIGKFKEEFERLLDRVQFIPLFVDSERKRKCREPWRGCLTICWDGSVTVCCADYNCELLIGNVKEARITDILNSPAAQGLRRLHSLKRFPHLCRHCSEYLCDGISPRFS